MIACAIAASYVGWEYFNTHDAGIGAGIIAVSIIYVFMNWHDKIQKQKAIDAEWNAILSNSLWRIRGRR